MSTPGPFARRVWLEPLAFAQATLLHGQPIPWTEPIALAQWLAKAHGLLGQPVCLLPLEAGITAWLLAHPGVTQELRMTKGPLGAVRALWAHPGFTDWLRALAQAVSTCLPPTQWVPLLPGPARLMQLLDTLLLDQPRPIDPEDAEDAAVYLANGLRSIPPTALHTLLIDLRVGDADVPAGVDTLHKVATHYQWQLGWRAHRVGALAQRPAACLLVDEIAHESSALPVSAPVGMPVEWAQAAAALATPAESDLAFLVLPLPADLAPEHLLPALRALSSPGAQPS